MNTYAKSDHVKLNATPKAAPWLANTGTKWSM